MRIAKEDIPVRLEAPGATARQLPDFGEADGVLGAEYFSLGAGTDLAPLFAGLVDDACQAPHWGFMIEGTVVITYTDGTVDRCRTGDVFHWPPGHCVRVEDDAEIILFSPQVSHGAVLDHLGERLARM